MVQRKHIARFYLIWIVIIAYAIGIELPLIQNKYSASTDHDVLRSNNSTKSRTQHGKFRTNEIYTTIISGTCSSNNYNDIEDVSTCMDAAESLGYKNCTSEVINSNAEVDGCSIQSGRIVGRAFRLNLNSKTHIVYNTIGLCDPHVAQSNCQCSKKVPCVCIGKNDKQEANDDWKMFGVTWSLYFNVSDEKSNLLEDSLLRWAFEMEIKNWINQDLQCSEAKGDEVQTEFRSVHFSQNRSMKIMTVEARGICKGDKCLGSKKNISSTTIDSEIQTIYNGKCEGIDNGPSIVQRIKKHVFSAFFYRHNVNVEPIRYKDDVDLIYEVSFEEVNKEGLDTIQKILITVESDPIMNEYVECNSTKCIAQSEIMKDIYTYFEIPENLDRHECSWIGVNCDDNDIVTQIWLGGYDFHEKTIPTSIGALVDLTGLFLGSNGLLGEIPTEVGLMRKLNSLWLRDNELSGTIPTEIGNLEHLMELNLHDNNLEGSISSFAPMNAIINLDLGHNDLIGSIPSSMGNLHSLRHITLAGNNLTGSVPIQLGLLIHLKTLVLAENNIIGTIPIQIGNLLNLEILDLRSNHIVGDLPSSLRNLKSLRSLNLYNNKLSRSIPTELKDLTHLTELILDLNNFSGTVPRELASLQNLNTLTLSSQSISGSLPSELKNLIALKNLDISSNRLSGTIPTSLGTLPSLQQLSVQNNLLVGTIPLTLGNLENLQYMNLQNNDLSGTIISEFGFLSNLRGLLLQGNNFTGTIPVELKNMRKIEIIGVYNTDLEGTAPNFFCDVTFLSYNVEAVYLVCEPTTNPSHSPSHINTFSPHSENPTTNAASNPNWFPRFNQRDLIEQILDGLGASIGIEANECNWIGIKCNSDNEVREIDLNYMSLSGTISSHIGKLRSILSLKLDSNNLKGTIPSEIGNIENLNYLSLRSNRLTGQIPTEIGNLFYLQYLFLTDNKLKGEIPNLEKLSSLHTFYVPYNSITGQLPTYWGMQMKSFHVSSNELTGTIPEAIGNSMNLEYLFLDNNDLTGKIPYQIGQLSKGLKKLSLYYNKLSGTLPTEIGLLQKVETIYLQNNLLRGTVPSELGKLTSLKYLSLNNNLLTGTLTPYLGNQTQLHTLNIKDTNIIGVGPEIICNIAHVIYENNQGVKCEG